MYQLYHLVPQFVHLWNGEPPFVRSFWKNDLTDMWNRKKQTNPTLRKRDQFLLVSEAGGGGIGWRGRKVQALGIRCKNTGNVTYSPRQRVTRLGGVLESRQESWSISSQGRETFSRSRRWRALTKLTAASFCSKCGWGHYTAHLNTHTVLFVSSVSVRLQGGKDTHGCFLQVSVSREGVEKRDGKQTLSMQFLPTRGCLIRTLVFAVYTQDVSEPQKEHSLTRSP